jgi:hypothetical protein
MIDEPSPLGLTAAAPRPGPTRHAVAAPRIGTGGAYFIIGGVFIALGVFAALAASGGAEGAGAFGSLAFTLGGGLVFIGFWISLFSKLEARLIDIQKIVAGGDLQSEIVSAKSGDAEADRAPSDREMMSMYGIVVDGDKYVFQNYRYDRLSDAINYAKKQK